MLCDGELYTFFFGNNTNTKTVIKFHHKNQLIFEFVCQTESHDSRGKNLGKEQRN